MWKVMGFGSAQAAVDTDFINHLLESRTTEDIGLYLVKVLTDLNLTAIMHPLVYQHELNKANEKINKLFADRVILKVEFANILPDEEARDYYIYLVKELLFSILGDASISEYTPDDIFNKWKYKSNYGEVHTISMCLIISCGIFLSDDDDSKYLKRVIEEKNLGQIIVYNREELLRKHTEEAETPIPRKERNRMSHSRCN